MLSCNASPPAIKIIFHCLKIHTNSFLKAPNYSSVIIKYNFRSYNLLSDILQNFNIQICINIFVVLVSSGTVAMSHLSLLWNTGKLIYVHIYINSPKISQRIPLDTQRREKKFHLWLSFIRPLSSSSTFLRVPFYTFIYTYIHLQT